MKKADFLKQENVPQFIKDLVANAPDDAEIGFHAIDLSTKKESCKCDEEGGSCDCKCKEVVDGINISGYLDTIGNNLVSIMDLTDKEGNVEKSDAKIIASRLDVIEATVDRLKDFVCMYANPTA